MLAKVWGIVIVVPWSEIFRVLFASKSIVIIVLAWHYWLLAWASLICQYAHYWAAIFPVRIQYFARTFLRLMKPRPCLYLRCIPMLRLSMYNAAMKKGMRICGVALALPPKLCWLQ